MNLCDYGCCPREVRDWFCGAGGAAMGLHRAWPHSHIVGYDIKPQKRYPFDFVQCDWSEAPLDGDFYWASPPCQRYSAMFNVRDKERSKTVDLVAPTRERLRQSGRFWCMENVSGSPLFASLMLCGSMFDLRSSPTRYLQRHRIFETSYPVPALGLQLPCRHWGLAVGVYGHGSAGHLGQRMRTAKAAEARVLMGIDWMSRDELSQAVPPAYSEYIARQLTAAIRA